MRLNLKRKKENRDKKKVNWDNLRCIHKYDFLTKL